MTEVQTLDKGLMAEKLAEMVNLAKQPANELKPYIDPTPSGVFYVTREQDKDTGEVKEKRTPLSSCFKHCGGGVDDDGNHYAVLEKPKHYGKPAKVIVLPLGMVGTGQGWSVLQNNGVMVNSPKQGREKLADHIQKEALNINHAITTKGGWHHDGKAYILPSGEVLTQQDDLNVIYNGDKSQAEAFKGKGTVQSWNDAIGRYIAGNSRLCLAVGTALAAPLLKLLGMESGGFHIHSDSSDGKTTSAFVALSIWAHPLMSKASWNGTGYAFTNLANSRNDNFMMLDEIGQASKQQAVCDVAYSVLNGTSKAQGAKDGGNRAMSIWRTLLFSTGEKPIRNYVEHGGKHQWQAGQETRLPSIPSNAGKGYGAFDTVHSFDNSKAFVDHLNHACTEHYGTVGAAFIGYLLSNQETTIATTRQYIDTFKATLPTMGNQAGRISDRFALVVSALQLAIDAGLLPLSHEEAAQAVKQCLDDWIARSGTGNYEERKIFEYGAAFFEQYAYNRFVSVSKASSNEHTPPNFAGLREERGEQTPLYWVLPSVFDAEICKDFDRAKVVQVYEATGWLLTPPTGRHKTKLKTFNGEKKRYYVFFGSVPPTEQDEEAE